MAHAMSAVVMKTTHRLLALSVLLLPLAVRAAVYIEPRVSLLEIAGTPSIGDLGTPIDQDFPRATGSLAVGVELTSRVKLELRYTGMGELRVMKVSPTWQVFPGDVLLPTLRKYEYVQRTDLLAVALPWRAIERNGWSLLLVPMLQAERARVELADIIDVMSIDFLPQRVPFHHRNDESVRFAGELSLGYAVNDRITAVLHYTYSPLRNFDAHLFGTGIGIKF